MLAKSDLELMIEEKEKILWRGRPNKKCYILEGIFNPLLPFALIWLLFDSAFFLAFTHGVEDSGELNLFLIPFFIFQMI